MAKHDWDTIRQEYITGCNTVTLESLAQKHGILPEQVRRQSARHKWVAQRDEYRAENNAEVLRNIGAREAEIRTQHLDVADGLLQRGLRALEEKNKKGETSLSDAELRRYLVDALALMRQAAGLPDSGAVNTIVIYPFEDGA